MENDEASVKDVKTMIQLRRCRKGRFIIRKSLNYLKLDFTKKNGSSLKTHSMALTS